MNLYHRSIASLIGVILIVVVSATLAVFGYFDLIQRRDQAVSQLTSQLTNSVAQSASGLALPIWNVDSQQISRNLVALMSDPQVVAVSLTTPEMSYHFARDPAGRPAQVDLPPQIHEAVISRNLPIDFSGRAIGDLTASASTRLLKQQIWDVIIQNGIRFIMIGAILVVTLFLCLRTLVISPLATLGSYASSMTTITGQLAMPSTDNKWFFGELLDLKGSVNRMLGLLNERFQELRINQERLQLATKAAAIGIWDWDVPRDILTWDDSMYALYGITRDRFDGAYQAWSNCIHPEDKAYAEGEIKAALAGEREYAADFRTIWPDGSVHYIKSASKTFRSADGKVLRMVGINYDATEKTLAEEELKRHRNHLESLVDMRTRELSAAKADAEGANRSKSVFLANMSHEIRTPLNAVLGYAQLLERSDSLSDEHRKAIQVINRSGEHLLQLINDILEMSRIEAGRSVCEMEDFDLPGLLDNLKSLFLQRTQAKGLAFDVFPSGPPPQFIRTDVRKLRQILINLLSNAVKFTNGGSVSVIATVHSGRLSVKVSDTGPGIDPLAQQQLFQPFVQTSEGRRRGDGTGLGLAISHGFARLMGGALAVESLVGSGSVFTLDIPIELASSAMRKVGRNQVVGLAPGQRPPRLLVAEDRPESREMLVELLMTTGCHVVAAANGAEAVSACQRESFDLIWMDIDMPVLDGLGAAVAIRALPGPAPVIIALTASAFAEDRHRILNGGCDEMTSKPFREEDLFRIMERHLDVHFTWKQTNPLPPATMDGSTDDELRHRWCSLLESERGRFSGALETGDTDACARLLSSWSDRPLASAVTAMLAAYDLDGIHRLIASQEDGHP